MTVDKNTGEIQGDEPRVRPFADFLLEQSSGHTHGELGEGLHDLIARVQDTGKKGSLTLTVVVEPMKGDTSTLVVTDEIKLRLPEHDRKGSVFFTDRDGNLTRHDPRQLHLPLREVASEAHPDPENLKDVQ
ncbi:MAG: hypothetical protein ACRDYU_03800 [Actinomycetes bacterium]